ncbi:MAG: large conductance mechanosensitive channel protein MscL [Hyphomicrobiaceae bacterium]
MSFLSEFKEFALKGNVMDLAVGVIIGGAFGKIIDSVVKHIIMPIVGAAGGSPDFSKITAGPVQIGSFIQSCVDFLILAFCIFMMVKAMNAARKRFEKPAAAATPPPPPASEVYLKEIRDALVKK